MVTGEGVPAWKRWRDERAAKIVPRFAMGELMGVPAKSVVVVPASPKCMIVQAATTLRGVRSEDVDRAAVLTRRKITLPARIHATIAGAKRRRHTSHVSLKRTAGAARTDPRRAAMRAAPSAGALVHDRKM
ncbi:hypothetical protein E1161_25120 [Saccharopolyspora aridisoli]|uniref:Uncharacterized protein n=1 Tax=Saccharopolyspora aridisoli TaxID=2530385 RepID=A0A4R4U9I2_9PSEU|nr:hypothetical protein [Saccharopolyspora aridisoli]TDC87740.1 hypothetical protein E1161_25120 [Saccharopolyspora aridisoli]